VGRSDNFLVCFKISTDDPFIDPFVQIVVALEGHDKVSFTEDAHHELEMFLKDSSVISYSAIRLT
jgi:hypothetical protein